LSFKDTNKTSFIISKPRTAMAQSYMPGVIFQATHHYYSSRVAQNNFKKRTFVSRCFHNFCTSARCTVNNQ